MRLHTKILADTADLADMRRVDPLVEGFTTNPSLMSRAGISSYPQFAREVLSIAHGRPVSFEVLSDHFREMEQQAEEMASWGDNVFVKIPITNAAGDRSWRLIRHLSERRVKLNITAILHRTQVEEAVSALTGEAPAFISIFAGRLADTGVDPVPLMTSMAVYVRRVNAEVIWASTRELYNAVQASDCQVPYITMAPALIQKLPLLGKDPIEYSLETVREFSQASQGIAMTDTKATHV